MKKALITGITGQDGSYLAEFLMAQGYTVYGLVRQAAQKLWNALSIYAIGSSCYRVIYSIKPLCLMLLPPVPHMKCTISPHSRL